METSVLLEGMRQKSKEYFNKKDYHAAGKINLAIEVIEEDERNKQIETETKKTKE